MFLRCAADSLCRCYIQSIIFNSECTRYSFSDKKCDRCDAVVWLLVAFDLVCIHRSGLRVFCQLAKVYNTSESDCAPNLLSVREHSLIMIGQHQHCIKINVIVLIQSYTCFHAIRNEFCCQTKGWIRRTKPVL